MATAISRNSPRVRHRVSILSPMSVATMTDESINMSAVSPKLLSTEAVQEPNKVITMGCGDTCLIFPGKSYEDWVLKDPAG